MKGYDWGERTTLISLYLAQLGTKLKNCTQADKSQFGVATKALAYLKHALANW